METTEQNERSASINLELLDDTAKLRDSFSVTRWLLFEFTKNLSDLFSENSGFETHAGSDEEKQPCSKMLALYEIRRTLPLLIASAERVSEHEKTLKHIYTILRANGKSAKSKS